ncbi:hypothetical protein AiwAL_14865 [Acidiphilium sp. AL]|uniref:Solute-binding protein family 3/N-terminal domain-containing protein n=1 Tax=Acidiphilium iwatense TaxID=768198 RepID=A0ABS9E118_9PROT|nr:MULTISPECIES: hypothetical protein [Acidiphilium]MCF3948707.1 hypothetical protein [Acidiphilium iwatense]MCU4161368.1 hypothetical protein [Acidiphilium sp. AL]
MADFPFTSRPRKRPGHFFVALTLTLAAFTAPAAAARLSFCLDKANPLFPIDRAVATAVAQADHAAPRFVVIDTRDGSDTLDARKPAFFAKLATRCDLVMGFPVEAGDPTLPRGVKATLAYAATGFVLANIGTKALSFAGLPAKTRVGVAYLTVPTTYFGTGHGAALTEYQYSSPASLYRALASHKINAALIWQPWLERHLAAASAKIAQHQPNLPHARWDIVALYRSAASAEAVRFNSAIGRLGPRHLAALIAPYRLPQ